MGHGSDGSRPTDEHPVSAPTTLMCGTPLVAAHEPVMASRHGSSDVPTATINGKPYTAAQIMAGISAAIRAGDMEAVVELLRPLTTVDPRSADLIVTSVQALR